MSEADLDAPATDDDAEGTDTDLETRIAELEAENRRLRQEQVAARRSTHRRTALGFAVLGLVALGGAALFREFATVLLALAGTGLFAGLLTWYITPERFIPGSVGERVFGSAADNAAAVVAELGLTDERYYVPVEGPTPARLYVPQRPSAQLPDAEDLQGFFVAVDDERRGVAFVPTGATLFPALERSLPGDLGPDADTIARQIADALVEDFEIADGVDVSVGDDQVTMRVRGSAFDPDAIDTPAASVLAVALVAGLDTAVTCDTAVEEEQLVVRCGIGESP